MEFYGKELKYQREQNNLSQCELAKQTGISQQNISRWERNEKEPGIHFCVQLADFYGITLDELVGRDYGREDKPKIKNDIRDNHGKIIFNQH